MNELRVICTDCGREFKNVKSGVLVKELFQKNKEVYRMWMADLLGCPKCGRVVVARFADNPIAEHWNKEKMEDALQRCETRTLGKDLFKWREHVQVHIAPTAASRVRKKRGGCPEFLRGKPGPKLKLKKVTQGKPEKDVRTSNISNNKEVKMKKICMILVLCLAVMIPCCKKKLPTQPDIPTTVLPTIASFTANPTSITLGESSTLSWSTTNATAISINQGIGNVSATGTVEVSPGLGTTTYTLTATNSDGQRTQACTVHVIPNYEGVWSGFYIISVCEDTGDFEGGCELFPPSSYQLYIELNLLQVQNQVAGYFYLGELFADAEGSIAENGQLLLTGRITEEGSPITIDVTMQLQSTVPDQITGELSQLWLGEGFSGYIQLSCNIVTLNRTSTMMTAVAPGVPRMQSPTLEDLVRALARR